MKINCNRRSMTIKLKPYCYGVDGDDSADLVEWENGEGWDVSINTRGSDRMFSLSRGEAQALMVAFNFEGRD